ncbi:MAG: transporter [Verrucomicrobiae bacterium]|nr:transporter [Verrucomicrobiae bacterium]
MYEWSAGGVAMGEAYMFAEDDPSLLGYNPAGITKLQGSWFSGGISYINPRGRVDFHGGSADGQTWSNDEAPGYVPNLFYVKQQNEKLWWGIGVFSRFGNSTQYDPAWPGRYNSYLAKITGITVQPTVAYKVTDKLSIAAGLDINYIRLEMNKMVPVREWDVKLDGHNIALGWNLGFNYDFTDNTSFAAVYRSTIKQDMDADVDINMGGVVTPTKAHGAVTLPDSLTFGFGHRFNENTRAEIGATYTKWSTYDKLEMTYDDVLGKVSDPKNWEDVWRYQVGIEHKLNDTWSIMGGYAYDNSPMPDETMDFAVPTGDRQTISIGFKKRSGNSELAFAWGYMWIKDRVIPASKKDLAGRTFTSADARDNTAHILSLSYTVHLK